MLVTEINTVVSVQTVDLFQNSMWLGAKVSTHLLTTRHIDSYKHEYKHTGLANFDDSGEHCHRVS
jgi:hypothetical protein